MMNGVIDTTDKTCPHHGDRCDISLENTGDGDGREDEFKLVADCGASGPWCKTKEEALAAWPMPATVTLKGPFTYEELRAIRESMEPGTIMHIDARGAPTEDSKTTFTMKLDVTDLLTVLDRVIEEQTESGNIPVVMLAKELRESFADNRIPGHGG